MHGMIKVAKELPATHAPGTAPRRAARTHFSKKTHGFCFEAVIMTKLYLIIDDYIIKIISNVQLGTSPSLGVWTSGPWLWW